MKKHIIASMILAAFATGTASATSTLNYTHSGANIQANSSSVVENSTNSTTEMCPPGQRMATRIVTGETGTTITEECVKPFSSTSS